MRPANYVNIYKNDLNTDATRLEEGRRKPVYAPKIPLNSLVLHFIFNLIKAFTVNEMINVLENRTK